MTSVWWGKEHRELDTVEAAAQGANAPADSTAAQPVLLPAEARRIREDIRRRRPHYTPEWSDPADVDAGGALAQLFAELMVPVRRRLNRLPEKSLVDFLRVAGIEPHPAQPAHAMVEFAMAPSATESTVVPRGFQLGATAADGSSDLVVFETQDDMVATPAVIEALSIQAGSAISDVKGSNDDPGGAFRPFGSRPRIGNALVIGLGNANTPPPSPTISLGIQVAPKPGRPNPVAHGGTLPAPPPSVHVLRWEALVDARFEPVEVLGDETRNLSRSGVVVLRLPLGWTPAVFEGDETPRFWLRLQLIHGRVDEPPVLSSLRPNMVAVRAVRTIRNEVLEAIGPVEPGADAGSQAADIFRPPVAGRQYQMRLRNTPVVPESVQIEIDATPLNDQAEPVVRWAEVTNLLDAGPDDHVFVLDPSSGMITFGDGTRGAAVPPGFRNVRAIRYETGGGTAGAVDANGIKTLLNSAAFVTGATNPWPASGGTDSEPRDETIRRGAEEIRARNRAVTITDYALMARRAAGAEVRRAHAIPAFHASLPRRSAAGVVTVFIVPPQPEVGLPIPDEAELTAVSRFLSKHVAPAGVEVVAAAPRYRFVRTEVGFVPDPAADPGGIVRGLIETLDRYLNPLTGGDDGQGWPFGAPLRFSVLMRRLLSSVPGVSAIPRLRLIVDGVPQRRCGDVALQRGELFWPEGHSVIPESGERG